ncbi:MAG: nucleotide-binding protein [Pseudomonadota bacterium]|nr:nucleotide-binding protein [Pseudomonadota bacterium]
MLTLLLSLLACDPAPVAPVASPLPYLSPAPTTAPSPSASPSASTAASTAAGAVTGIVAENLAAGPYTYTRATLADGSEVWAAATGDQPAVGTTITISTSLPMREFHSDTLNRTFPLVYFVSSYGSDVALTVPATGTALPAGHPSLEPAVAGAGAGAAPAVAAPAVAGVRKVADVWAERASLGGREVTISGEVVKSTAAVMGRNWLHIRDGSGAEGTNDLTVTTAATAAIGDHVQVRGVVALDQDFGGGYTYPVLITSADVQVAPAN